MTIQEHRRGNYLISTDKSKLDVDAIHDYLSNTAYWALGRPLSVVRESIQESLCFGLYEGQHQAGFARVVTDYATFAWLCDVFVLEPYRGRGLAKWMVECVVAHPSLKDLRLFILATSDVHGLYERYGGFERVVDPSKIMVRRGPEYE